MSADSAVRFFAPDNPRLAHTVRAKLVQEHNLRANHLIDGFAQDWGDYKERIGSLKGIQRAIEICDEAEKELD